jgi:uncharacterized protein YndB with AHSA1/START domain
MPTTRIDDETVKAKTGRSWHEWFDILENASADKLNHQEIVNLLSRRHDLNDWWSQMVANVYEQHARIHEQYERAEGYEISVSKTFQVDVRIIYDACFTDEKRRRWLQESPLKITTSTRNKSIRAQWENGKSRLSIDFYSKGENRSQVVVQHMKLPSLKAAEDMQTFWKEKLDALEEMVRKNRKGGTPEQEPARSD